MKKISLKMAISNGASFPIYSNGFLTNGKTGYSAANNSILEQQIIYFVKKRPNAYISDISENLEIPILRAIKLLKDLENRGKIHAK